MWFLGFGSRWLIAAYVSIKNDAVLLSTTTNPLWHINGLYIHLAADFHFLSNCADFWCPFFFVSSLDEIHCFSNLTSTRTERQPWVHIVLIRCEMLSFFQLGNYSLPSIGRVGGGRSVGHPFNCRCWTYCEGIFHPPFSRLFPHRCSV